MDSDEENDDEWIEEEFEREELWVSKNIEWKPELDALFRYGGWLTPKRQFTMDDDCTIVGMPENFMEEWILHLMNSRYNFEFK